MKNITKPLIIAIMLMCAVVVLPITTHSLTKQTVSIGKAAAAKKIVQPLKYVEIIDQSKNIIQGAFINIDNNLNALTLESNYTPIPQNVKTINYIKVNNIKISINKDITVKDCIIQIDSTKHLMTSINTNANLGII